MSAHSPAASPRKAVISRRGLLAAGTGAGGMLFLASAGRRSVLGADATPQAGHESHAEADGAAGLFQPSAWESVDLAEPEVRHSVDGELATTLRVAYAHADTGGYRLSLRTYEGAIPGPTLRVQPGDVLRVTLINDLPPNRAEMPLNTDLPHHFNTTNVHVHGLHVSPSGNADNVFRSMEPGQSYEIEIAVPADHPRGTYWYHPHHHGSADVQISSGMAGALIVEGDFAGVAEIENAVERVLVVNEVMFDYLGAIEVYDTIWPEAAPRFISINGQREPVIRLRPGEVQRWRIIQAAHESNLRLALDDHLLHPIAYDGIPRSRIEGLESLIVAPGQRADVLVQAGAAGAYKLQAIANDQGYPSPTGPLAHVVVEGEPLTMSLPATLPESPLAPIGDDEITGARTITFTAIEPEVPAAATYQEFAFLIDGRRFDPDRVDHSIRLGAVEEWTVVNDHHDDHVFHIHTNPFQVMAINGEPVSEPLWRDTVIVPRDGSLTFRSRFLDFTGKTVLHCHMMNHEELGMMQLIEFTE
ncbi:MAG TPA: multicopper oxidase family protein [Thermomicrobiales bacterium]|nr:multicopper oxidase family protein [Thermomicrobiales bacterium]